MNTELIVHRVTHLEACNRNDIDPNRPRCFRAARYASISLADAGSSIAFTGSDPMRVLGAITSEQRCVLPIKWRATHSMRFGSRSHRVLRADRRQAADGLAMVARSRASHRPMGRVHRQVRRRPTNRRPRRTSNRFNPTPSPLSNHRHRAHDHSRDLFVATVQKEIPHASALVASLLRRKLLTSQSLHQTLCTDGSIFHVMMQ